MKEKDLLDLKEDITKAKEKEISLKGEKKNEIARLKKEMKCDTTEDAKKKLKKLKKESEKLDEKFNKGIKELNQIMEGANNET